MTKNVESAKELKQRILHGTELEGDDGMQADSPGGYPDPIIEEGEPGEVQSEEEDAGLEAEELDPVTYMQKWAEEKEQERLATMDINSKSLYRRAQRAVEAKEKAELEGAFLEDVDETLFELKEFPLVMEQFKGEFRFGKVPPLSDERLATSGSPPLEKIADWVYKNKEKVMALLAKENHPQRTVYERFKKLVNALNSPSPVGCRARDKMLGYDRQEKMTDEQIKKAMDYYLEE